MAYVIVDGKQTKHRGSYTPLDKASQGLKNKGVEIFAIGIGNKLDDGELNAIASSKGHVLKFPSFRELKIPKRIIENICGKSSMFYIN